MTDKRMIEILREYAKSYTNDKPYLLNPGFVLMIAKRMEQLAEIAEDKTQKDEQ